MIDDSETVCECHRLQLVVRHVKCSDTKPTLELLELGAGVRADLRVKIGQRLVHQEECRFAHDGASERNALLLSAGKLMRLALKQRINAEHVYDALDTPRDLVARHVMTLEAKREIVPHGHVRIERVILEYHGDVARFGGHRRDVGLAEQDSTGVKLDETRYGTQ